MVFTLKFRELYLIPGIWVLKSLWGDVEKLVAGIFLILCLTFVFFHLQIDEVANPPLLSQCTPFNNRLIVMT